MRQQLIKSSLREARDQQPRVRTCQVPRYGAMRISSVTCFIPSIDDYGLGIFHPLVPAWISSHSFPQSVSHASPIAQGQLISAAHHGPSPVRRDARTMCAPSLTLGAVPWGCPGYAPRPDRGSSTGDGRDVLPRVRQLHAHCVSGGRGMRPAPRTSQWDFWALTCFVTKAATRLMSSLDSRL